MSSRQLTIYLIKEDVTSEEDIIDNADNLTQFEIEGIGTLYIRPSYPRTPAWASLFADVLTNEELQSRSSSTAAVLLMNNSNRLFALTFGYGRSLLNPDCFVERFGLLVTLNSVGRDKLRSIDKKTFDAISRHSREQSSREVSASDFGLDIEQDFLRAVTGSPEDSTLGKRMTGIDPLSVAITTELGDIPALLGRYIDQYQQTSYRETFPWVDQISEVRNASLINELNEQLVENIRNELFERLWIAVPDIMDWSQVGGFKYTQSPLRDTEDDIHLSAFMESLRDPASLRLETLKQRRIFCYSSASDALISKWPVYHCIYCEIDMDGDTYLLNGGKWFRVAQGFVEQINEFIGAIPASSVTLPAYSDNSEGEYNERVCADGSGAYALMDRAQIPYGGGHSSIEFCDIYTLSRQIIHVKRYGGSSVLSHLFSQGLVSAELFLTDQNFRDLVNDRLPAAHRIQNPHLQPTSSEYEIVYAIVSNLEDDLTLPFFSRVNLRHAARRLRGYGYNISLLKIPVEEASEDGSN